VRKDVQYRNGYAVVEVGSGEWRFEAMR
jgi:hypothetical protein